MRLCIIILLILFINLVFAAMLISYRSITKSFNKATSSIYFHGFRLDHVIENMFFQRIGCYIGHGLRYEVAALMAIALKDNRHTSLVWANSSIDPANPKKHAFIEVKHLFFTWCVDASWGHPVWIVWKPAYYRIYQFKKPNKTFSYDELWDWPETKILASKLLNATSSHILFELYTFRRCENNLSFNKIPEQILNSKDLGKHYPIYANDFHSDDHLITERIIRDFLRRSRRMRPKAKSIRRANKARKDFQRLISEGQAISI